MQGHTPIKTNRYFDPSEIDAHLFGVEYIMMAAPSPDQFKDSPIHFTIFLNTKEALPAEAEKAVFEKFCEQYNITATAEYFGGVAAVGFAQTQQETPMPMFLVKEEDRRSIPHTAMFVMDFLGDSTDFKEPKEGLTGWSYSYA